MARFKVGVQLLPQHTSVDALRGAARAADEMGVDSIWTWDHFFPLFGPEDGNHFEAWTLLAAFAADTSRAMLGTLVSGNTYRNPELLVDMARTVDHVSGGRAYLGVGAGWFQRDHDEYGYDFGTEGSRLRLLEEGLRRIRSRVGKLSPAPVGRLPVLVGGAGEKVTLRLVATYADAWNTFGPPGSWAAKNRVLDEWCREVGRDPTEIERTVLLNVPHELDDVEAYVEAGCDHILVGASDPFDLSHIQRALDLANG